MDSRPVLYVLGVFLSVLAVSMSLPMLVDLYFNNPDWKVFFFCIITTAFFGGTLVLTNSATSGFDLSVRQAFILTTLSWVVIAAFGALPFRFSGLGMNFTDAYFESMSGITTTGSTVMTGLDHVPPGILLWRALLQWLGGIGIIVMALSVLPFLKVGGMQLFRTESSENEKVMPRAAKMASSIGYVYLLLTLICALGYYASGMTLFESAAHAMTTIATGGFSTTDASFRNFSLGADVNAIIFMTLGALPFALYIKAINGNVTALFKDSQVRFFMGLLLLSCLGMIIFLVSQSILPLPEALRRGVFNVTSMVSGTGYANYDYNLWGGFAVNLLFFLMVTGGCAGSTSCGIKIFRFQVLYAMTNLQIKKLLHPHGVFIPHYGGKPIPRGVPGAVMSFFFLYALCFSVIALALSFTGLDFLTAMSGSATAISNVGPGFGEVGPSSTFQELSQSAKWILSAAMLLGRLELFTVLVLFWPNFWRR